MVPVRDSPQLPMIMANLEQTLTSDSRYLDHASNATARIRPAPIIHIRPLSLSLSLSFEPLPSFLPHENPLDTALAQGSSHSVPDLSTDAFTIHVSRFTASRLCASFEPNHHQFYPSSSATISSPFSSDPESRHSFFICSVSRPWASRKPTLFFPPCGSDAVATVHYQIASNGSPSMSLCNHQSCAATVHRSATASLLMISILRFALLRSHFLTDRIVCSSPLSSPTCHRKPPKRVARHLQHAPASVTIHDQTLVGVVLSLAAMLPSTTG